MKLQTHYRGGTYDLSEVITTRRTHIMKRPVWSNELHNPTWVLIINTRLKPAKDVTNEYERNTRKKENRK